MRRPLALPILLLLFGCGNGLGSTNDLSGTWVGILGPGSFWVLTLTQQGTGITGTGTQNIEADGFRTLQVAGTYLKPAVNLSLHYDYGQDQAYTGILQDGSHITGALEGIALPLTRR